MDQPRAEREPHFTRVGDGIWAQVEDRSGSLPRHLDSTAHEGRIRVCRCRPLIESMTGLQVHPVVLAGTRLACRDQHDLLLYATGAYAGLELRLSICRYCGAIEVRDVSLDFLVEDDARTGRRLYITKPTPGRRRDLVLGWYAGRRVSGRIYR